jgi:hypothetical protein
MGWIASLAFLGGAVPALAAPFPQVKQDTGSELQSDLSWQLVSSTAGRFLVELPGAPEEKTGTLTVLNTELTWHTMAVKIPTVDRADGVDLFEYYMVSYADLPRRLTYEHSQKAILDAVVNSLVTTLDNPDILQTLTTDEIAFRGLPARLMTADCFEQFCVGGVMMTNDRLYLTLAIDDDRDSFKYFFESLTFVP